MSEITGKIKMIGETATFGSAGFRKRELVITTDEQYPQDILIEFVQDKCDVLNDYSKGQSVKVGINIRGREWTNPQGEVKYFNSLQGWRISKAGQNNPLPAEPFAPAGDLNEDDNFDLPF